MPALLFDCDGVLGDTERHGHLVAFNEMWRRLGVPWSWSDAQYRDKLKIGGGKERMASLFGEPEFLDRVRPPADPAAREALVRLWHQQKTAIYTELVDSGRIPGRPGIRRLVGECLDAGWTLAVCSTSAHPSVVAVLEAAVGAASAQRFAGIFAGDVVAKKKPAPDIYLLAVERLRLDPAQTMVCEDSRNGLLAARAAGLRCLVTVNDYTRDEDFSGAELVVSSLGDAAEPAVAIANPRQVPLAGQVTMATIQALLSAR
jgi:HAD superfamily hydrolase (TIGR01509 family)